MARSEALKAAQARYNKANLKSVTVKFSPQDHDLFRYLGAQESRAGHIKQLIRADMEQAIASGEYVPDMPSVEDKEVE